MALNLKFALNLNTIADEMMENVKRAWKSPFDPPTIIFSEYKLAQWFRLRWVEKFGVLSNLNYKSMDRFLLDILGENDQVQKLSSEMLRNTIIAYIQKLAAEKRLGTELAPVAKYLGCENSLEASTKPAQDFEQRLFDLAGKLASLFLDYEITRPSGFMKNCDGILDCWKEGNLRTFFKDGGAEVPNESWERKLYSAIFHNAGGDSLMTSAFKKLNPDKLYLTLPFMYEACKKEGVPQFHFESKNPVFILGLSGMGQFYRTVLNEFAKTHEVNAYIQNPCMKFWEDLKGRIPTNWMNVGEDEDEPLKEDENDLLRAWGRAGRDSIKLWCQTVDYNFDFDGAEKATMEEEKPSGSLLKEIQKSIAERRNLGEFELSKFDESLTLTSAPNRIREVEAVHSRICRLLASGAKLQDILVVAPNISDYRSAICQVFDQSEHGSEKDVHLPFVIVDSAEKKFFVENALENLFAIKKSKAIDRPNFFALVRNPVVQAARRIDPEEISAWEGWVGGMNVYRDHTALSNQKEDWLDGVKRLLLSRLTDSVVGDELLPYADMESADDASLNRFAETVESLERWIQLPEISDGENGFSELRKFLCEWLQMQDAPQGLGGEPIVFDRVLEALDSLKYQFAAGASKISWTFVSMTLQEAAQGSSYSCGNLFIGGISFMKFAPNRTIPVKHLFFMGANAKDFPGSKNSDSLDLRKSVHRWPGDDSAVDRNRYAFLCQLMSTSESFHISYQGKYLPKDEELYPSSVVNDLQNFLGERKLKILEITIDESRKWSELFTAREWRNKETLGFFQSENKELNPPPKNAAGKENFPARVSAYSVRKFLENPFEFQAGRVLNLEEVVEDSEKIAFEPTDLNALENSVLLKNLVAAKLGVSADAELNEQTLRLKGTLPAGKFGENVWKNLNELAGQFAERIQTEYADKKFSSKKLDVLISGKPSWNLSGTISIFAEHEKTALLVGVKNKALTDPNSKSSRTDPTVRRQKWAVEFLPLYVPALGLLASGDFDSATLHVFAESTDQKFTVKLSPEKAQHRLNDLYQKMFTEKFGKLVPFSSLAFNAPDAQKIPNIWDLKKKLQFFSGKDLVDVRSACGFDLQNFKEEWSEASQKMIGLIPELENYIKGE